MNTTTTTYTAIGNIRGDCGHRHRTPVAAARCLDRDRQGCAAQGGYSDRQIEGSDGSIWECERVDGELWVYDLGL